MKKLTFITAIILIIASLFGQATIKNPNSKSDFLKQPYLIFEGNNTGMRIIWQLNETAPCEFFLGDNNTYNLGNATTTEYDDDHQHGYTITGLTPNTKYYYKVVYDDAIIEASFNTAPEEEATDLKFFMYGDTRTQFAVHDAVSESMIADYTADADYQTITICTGDLVTFGAEESNWQNQFFNSTTPNIRQRMAEVPFVSCLGNHELYYNNYTGVNLSSPLFGKYFPYPFVERRYWSFDYGPVHFTYIDLYPANYDPYGQGLIDDDQLAWIENDLSSTTKEWKIVVLHEPGWSAGGSSSGYLHPNNEDVQNLLQPFCEQYGVQLVFGGHNHYYAKACKNGIYHLTAAGGGAPLYSPDPDYPNVMKTRQIHHYCKAEIMDATLSVTVLTPGGEVVDEITIGQDFLPGHLLGYLNKEEGYGDISDVLIEVDGEIAQPDSIGYYGLQLDAGIYNVTFSLGSYESITETVEIFEGTETQLDTMLMLGLGCLPEGITFETQEQIDNFQINHPNCLEIEGDVEISGNEITNLNGLNILSAIGGSLYIWECGSLTSLTGLNNLSYIGDDLYIGGLDVGNPLLNSLTGLDNLTTIGGDLVILNNPVLTSLLGLGNLISVNGFFSMGNNHSLSCLSGLGSLLSIEGWFGIFDHDDLTTLSGLEGLISVGGNLSIEGNHALINVTGLENLISIGGNLRVKFNDVLTSLTGLDSIEAGSITNLYIHDNDILSTCEVQSICTYLASPNGNISIHDNAPGCNSPEEVQDICFQGVEKEETLNGTDFNIYPSLVNDFATLQFQSDQPCNGVIEIFNATGVRIKSRQITTDKAGQQHFVMDFRSLPVGMYLCKVQIGDRVVVKKIIKQ